MTTFFYSIIGNSNCAPKRHPYSKSILELVSNVDISIYPNTQEVVDTGIVMKLTSGYMGIISTREAQSIQNIFVTSMVVGVGLTEETIKVAIRNNGSRTYKIIAGVTKIAQVLLVREIPFDLEETTVKDIYYKFTTLTSGIADDN